MRKQFWLYIVSVSILFSGCGIGDAGKSGSGKEEKENLVSYPDKAFANFFARDCCGMTGADGTYSVLLPDGRTAWIFGDTFLGTVNEDFSREKGDPLFVRNTIAVQDGDNLTTYYGKHDGKAASLLIPEGAPIGGPFSEDSVWYWPGDGFVENGKFKLFLSKFYQASEGNWGFKWDGTYLAVFTLPGLKLETIEQIAYRGEVEVHWGHAVCDDARDFTYIYGLGSGKPYVARANKGEVTSEWEFFAGSHWSNNVNDADPMVDFQGSEQFSVFKLNDLYVYVSQAGGFSQEVCSFISDNPYTGWTNKKSLFMAVAPVQDTNLFVYNAVAHPQFTEDNHLLVSYNVNSFELNDLFEDARKYRPVFYRVPLSLIVNE
jgi:hypothetical protein